MAANLSLPDQIPPQSAPFVYDDGSGILRMEVDWYLFLYNLWVSVSSGQKGGVALLDSVSIVMSELDDAGSDTAQTQRLIANATLLQPDPDVGPSIQDVRNALVLALDALLQDPGSTSSGGGITALTGDVTASGTGSVAATIAAKAVTYAKIQDSSAGEVVLTRANAAAGTYGETALAASQLLGRGASGDIAAISLDPSLTMTGAVLSASGGVSIGLALQLPQVSIFIG